tara:strand:- start:484 stop:699 length:216 start_codon:yes stop_codon:yes gene_type:complete
MPESELNELRASSSYADPVIQRAAELEERLLVTVEALKEHHTMPEIMKPLSMAAIIVDITETINREWLCNA